MTMDFMICEAPLDSSFQKERLQLVNKGSLGRRRKPSRSYLKLHLSPTDTSLQVSPLFDQRSLSAVSPVCNGVRKEQTQTPEGTPRCPSPQRSRLRKEVSLPRTTATSTTKPLHSTPIPKNNSDATCGVKRKLSDAGRSAVLIQTWERRTRFDAELKLQQKQKQQQQKQQRLSIRNRLEDKENEPIVAMPDSCIRRKYRGNLEFGDGGGKQDGGRSGVVRDNIYEGTKKTTHQNECNGFGAAKYERPIYKEKNRKKSEEEVPEWVSLSRKLCAKFVEDHLDNEDTCQEPAPFNKKESSEAKPEILIEKAVIKQHNVSIVKQQHTREIHKVSHKLQKQQLNAVIVPKPKKPVDVSEVKLSDEPPWIHLSRKLCTKFIEQHIEYPKHTESSKPENRPDIEPKCDVRIIEKIGNKTGTQNSKTKKPEPEWISLSRKLRAKFIESHIDDPDTISLENQLNVSDPEETSSESLPDAHQINGYGNVANINKASRQNSQKLCADRYHSEVEVLSPVLRSRPKEDMCWEYIETDLPVQHGTSQNIVTCSSNENKLQHSPTSRFNSVSEQITTSRLNTNSVSNGYSQNSFSNSVYSTPLCKSTIIYNGIDHTSPRNQLDCIEEGKYAKTNIRNEISPINSCNNSSQHHQDLTRRSFHEQEVLNSDQFHKNKSNGHAQSPNPCFNGSKYSRNFSQSEIQHNDVLFAPRDFAESESNNENGDGKIFVEFHNGFEMKQKEENTYKYFVAENKVIHDKKQPIDASYFNLSTWEEAHYHSDRSDHEQNCEAEITSNNLRKKSLSKSMNTIYDFKEKNGVSEGKLNVDNSQCLQLESFKNQKTHYKSENSLCKTNIINDSSGSDCLQNSQQTSRLSKVTLKCNTSFNRSRHQILEVNNSPKKKQQNLDKYFSVPQCSSSEVRNETKAVKEKSLSESSKSYSCRKAFNEIDKRIPQKSTETISKCLDFSDEYFEPIDSRPMLLQKRSYISRSDEALYKRECVSLKSQVPFQEASLNQNDKMGPYKQDRRSESMYSVQKNDSVVSNVVPVSVSPKKEPSPREIRFKQSILQENSITENNVVSDSISPSPRDKRFKQRDFVDNDMIVDNVVSDSIPSETEFSSKENFFKQNIFQENDMRIKVAHESVFPKGEISPKDKHFNQTNFTTPEKAERDLSYISNSDCRPTLNKIISHKSNSVDCLQETHQQDSFDDVSFNDSKVHNRYYSQIEPLVVISQSNQPKTTFEYQSEIPLSAKLVSKQNDADTNTRSSSSVSIRNESPYFETPNSATYEDLFKETTSCPSDSETSSWTVMKKNTYYVNGRSSSMNDLDFSDCSLSVKCDYASSSNQSTIQSCASSSFYVNLRDYDSHMLEPSRKKEVSKTHSNGNVHKLSASNPPTPETLRNLFTSPLKNINPPQNHAPSKIIARMPPEANQHHYYSVEPSSSYKHIFDPKPSKVKKSERSSSIKIKDIAHGIILTFRRFQNHSKSHVSPSHYVDVSHLAQSGNNVKASNGFDSDKGKKKNSHGKNRRNLSVENIMRTDSDSGCATTSESYGLKHPKFGSDVVAPRFSNELIHQENQTRNLGFNDKKKVKNGKKSGDKSKKNKGKGFEPRTIPTVSRKVQQMADGTLYLVTTVSGDSTMPGVYSDSPDTSSELSLSRPVKLTGESNC